MQNLKQYFWDYDFSEKELNKLLAGEEKRVGHLDIESLYSRILTSTKWYEMLETIGRENLQKALADTVIEKIKSIELKKKLRVAKRTLYG